MLLSKRIVSLGAAALMLLSTTGPAMAATKIKIRGNGADSRNTVTLRMSKKDRLTQINQTISQNIIGIQANTGDNEANKNTGGSNSIDTGDIITGIIIDNNGSDNQATDDCGCPDDDLTVAIKNNGADSKNDVDVHVEYQRLQEQVNFTSHTNLVDLTLNTGDNEANKNTGDEGSDPSINTGDIEIGIDITNQGGDNIIE